MIGKNTRPYEGNEESAEPEGMARKEYEQECTHPELRKELLEDQASTRAAERPLVATPRSGVREEGGCKSEKDEKDESQEVLKKWTDEEHTNRKTLLGQLERKLGE